MYATPLAAAVAVLTVPVAVGTEVSLLNITTAGEAADQFGGRYDFGTDPSASVIVPHVGNQVLFGAPEAVSLLEGIAERDPDLSLPTANRGEVPLAKVVRRERRATFWGAEMGALDMPSVNRAADARLAAIHSALLVSQAFRATNDDQASVSTMVSQIPGVKNFQMDLEGVASFTYKDLELKVQAYSQGRYHLLMRRWNGDWTLIREGRANEAGAQDNLARLLQALTRGRIPVSN